MTARIWAQATNLIHFQRKNMGSPDFYVNSSDFLIWHLKKYMYWYINFVLSKKVKIKKTLYSKQPKRAGTCRWLAANSPLNQEG